MTRKAIPVLVSIVIVLSVTGDTSGSNMGFKKTFTFTKGIPANNVHWISLPFFYNPAQSGIGTLGTWNTVVDSEDLGADLGGSLNFSIVFRYNPVSGALDSYFVNTTCSGVFQVSGPPQGAIGVGVKVSASAPSTVSAFVVGTHDNAYSKTYSSGIPTNNVHWVSVPYHFRAADCGAGTMGTFANRIDAEDFACQLGGPGKVVFVFRYNPISGALDTWIVGSTSTAALYAIDIGAAIGFKNAPGQSVTYAPQHY